MFLNYQIFYNKTGRVYDKKKKEEKKKEKKCTLFFKMNRQLAIHCLLLILPR